MVDLQCFENRQPTCMIRFFGKYRWPAIKTVKNSADHVGGYQFSQVCQTSEVSQ